MTNRRSGDLAAFLEVYADGLTDMVENAPNIFEPEAEKFREAAQRLREMEGGIEGWARQLADKRTYYFMYSKPVSPISDRDKPALLIILPQGGGDDGE